MQLGERRAYIVDQIDMKYPLSNYIKAYAEHICSIQFWGHALWVIMPKAIRKYWIATIMLEHHESGRALYSDHDIKKAEAYVNQ